MPLIEKEDRREQEPLRVRLQPAVAEQLKAYAKFADSSDAHIINAALQRLFAADKEFKDYLDKNPDAGKPEPEKQTPPAIHKPRRAKDTDAPSATNAA